MDIVLQNQIKIYSEKEIAGALGISTWTVRRLRLQAGLPHFRTAGRIFYRMEAVLHWMETEERKSENQTRSIS